MTTTRQRHAWGAECLAPLTLFLGIVLGVVLSLLSALLLFCLAGRERRS